VGEGVWGVWWLWRGGFFFFCFCLGLEFFGVLDFGLVGGGVVKCLW